MNGGVGRGVCVCAECSCGGVQNGGVQNGGEGVQNGGRRCTKWRARRKGTERREGERKDVK
jgi:hypothetical protein